MKEEKLRQENAFPIVSFDRYGDITSEETFNGMSKRFYAACFAMQGIISNSLIVESLSKDRNTNETTSEIIKMAYECSDELLKQETK